MSRFPDGAFQVLPAFVHIVADEFFHFACTQALVGRVAHDDQNWRIALDGVGLPAFGHHRRAEKRQMRLHARRIGRRGQGVGQENRQPGGGGASPGDLPRHPVMRDGIRPHQQFEAVHPLSERLDFRRNRTFAISLFGPARSLAGGGDQECARAAGGVEQLNLFVEQTGAFERSAQRPVHFRDDQPDDLGRRVIDSIPLDGLGVENAQEVLIEVEHRVPAVRRRQQNRIDGVHGIHRHVEGGAEHGPHFVQGQRPKRAAQERPRRIGK